MKIDIEEIKEKLAKIIAFSAIVYFMLYGICGFALDTWGAEDIDNPFSKSHYSASYIVCVEYNQSTAKCVADISVRRTSLYKSPKIFLEKLYIADLELVPYDECELFVGRKIECQLQEERIEIPDFINSMTFSENGDVKMNIDEEAFQKYFDNILKDGPNYFYIYIELTKEKIVE